MYMHKLVLNRNKVNSLKVSGEVEGTVYVAQILVDRKMLQWEFGNYFLNASFCFPEKWEAK